MDNQLEPIVRKLQADFGAAVDEFRGEAHVTVSTERVIATLEARGYRVGRIHGPDGKPYDQVIAFGNPGDPVAQPYRVTAGGGPIRRAIEYGYTDESVPWGDVR